MPHIGFSTGCLYWLNLEIDKAIELYHPFGATAIELSFAKPFNLLSFELSKEIINDIKKYNFVSVHAPWKELRYDRNRDTQRLIDKLIYFSENLNIEGIVLHPDVINNFSFLNNSDLPFLLENMDKRKKFGRKDVHHAYWNCYSMKLGFELVELFGDRLKEMHISGWGSTGCHSPVYSSANKNEITKILELGIKVPKILEGYLSYRFNQEIPKELSFVKNYEKNT